MYDVKTTCCIYFVAFVFFYFGFGIMETTQPIILDFPTALQIMAACVLIGFGQGLLISKNNLTLPRVLIWGIWSFLVTIGFSSAFQWFDAYPDWYKIVFYSFIAISFILMFLALQWHLQRETKKLNEALYEFKEKSNK
jgi:hypothetical protein